MFIWNTLTYPNTPGTFHLQVELFCYQDLLVCHLEMIMYFFWHVYAFFFSFLRANLTACLIPTEPYHQMLAKALAHYFESKLLLLDVTDFSIKVTRSALFHHPPSQKKKKNLAPHTIIIICHFCILQMQSKYGCTRKESVSILCSSHISVTLCCNSVERKF